MKNNLILILLFSSLVKAESTPLKFDEALQRILDRSTDIQVQQTNVDAADYSVTGKKGAFLPNLTASAGRGNSTTNGTYAVPYQSGSISSGINLFRWGSDMSQLEGAEEDLRGAKDSLENVKLSTEDVGVLALAADIQSRMHKEVLQKDVAAYENYFEIAKQRFKRGLLAKEEVDKVYLDFSNAQARLKDTEAQSALAKAQLAKLLGFEAVVKEEWPWKTRLRSHKISEILKITPNLNDRPDIRAALDNVNAENARLKSGRDTLYPALDFSVNQGFSENEDGSNQGTTTSLNVSLDIFDRLSNYSQYKIQYETYAAADLRLRQLKLDAEAAWVAARDQFSIALETALDRDKSYEIAQRLYNTNELRFKQGRASANDLEVDHRRLIDSSLLEVDGWRAAHEQFTKLCHTLGRSVQTCEMAL